MKRQHKRKGRRKYRLVLSLLNLLLLGLLIFGGLRIYEMFQEQEFQKKITEVTEELIRDFLDERKLSLWACEFVKEGPDYFLRVYIDKEEGYVGTQECEEVSRFLSDKLDEQDLIEREYYLEVSSPGMDRELITQEHFDRYVGSEIEIKLYKAIDKKKQLVGTLVSLNDGIVKITVDGKDMELPRDQIAKANLAVIF